MEAGALELEKMPVDLTETIGSSVELVASKAAEKGIELACRINPDVPAAMIGDPVRLKQILMNLLNNAAKFTEIDEVVLTVSLMIHGASTKPGETTLLTFEVRDSGIGIPKDRMDRLFKSFSPVDASITRRFDGTGLGLVITKRLVGLMGREISVESEVGRGTTFSFTLLAEVAQLHDKASQEAQLAAIKGARLLIVDDNRTNRLILSKKFRAWNLRPRASETPREALEIIREGEAFDLDIIDYEMPLMNGFEFTAAVREHLGDAAPPMILFSSVSPMEERFREGAEKMNCTATLSKPAKSGQLLSALVRELAPGIATADARSGGAQVLPGVDEDFRILLVDDNAINQKVGRKIRKRLGFDPVVVGSGEEAIAACRGEDYDIVLMDIEMPDMDGIAATNRIRKIISEAGVPDIRAPTVNAMNSERENYLKSGMDDDLSKPIDVDALTKSIDASRRLKEERAPAPSA